MKINPLEAKPTFKEIRLENRRLLSNMKTILAFGAESKGSICVIKKDYLIYSQPIGNLQNLEEIVVYERCINDILSQLPRLDCIVTDLHPDYISTQFAEKVSLTQKNTQFFKIQHHHSHMAASLAENNIEQDAIGIIFDGSGLGEDNRSWGGEFFVADLKEYKRLYHFEDVKLIGIDKSASEPYRMAVAYLYEIFKDDILSYDLYLFKRIGKEMVNSLINIIKKNINIYQTTSCGRLFDCVSSLIGVCDKSGYEAQAAIELERIADKDIKESYTFEILEDTISFKAMIKEIISDLSKAISKDIISAKFHNTIARVILDVSKKIRKDLGINIVSLSGGVFQNRFLLDRSVSLLKKEGFDICINEDIPITDAGVAFGQAMVALYNDK